MSSMRDFAKKDNYLRPKKGLSSSAFVGWGVLVCMGMALGFMFGYGLLYTQCIIHDMNVEYSPKVIDGDPNP